MTHPNWFTFILQSQSWDDMDPLPPPPDWVINIFGAFLCTLAVCWGIYYWEQQKKKKDPPGIYRNTDSTPHQGVVRSPRKIGNPRIADRALMSTVHKGLTRDEVREILGEPESIDVSGASVEKWGYEFNDESIPNHYRASVWFGENEKVVWWKSTESGT